MTRKLLEEWAYSLLKEFSVQLNEYETAPYLIQLSQNLTSDCLLTFVFQVKTQKSTSNPMSSFGLIEKNMELSHIHLAVLLKKWLYGWQIEKNASIFFFKRASITATPSNQRFFRPSILSIVHEFIWSCKKVWLISKPNT